MSVIELSVFSTFLIAIGMYLGDRGVRKEAIERGFARVGESGKFTWNESEAK